jgi:hypothetical protein
LLMLPVRIAICWTAPFQFSPGAKPLDGVRVKIL